MSKSSSKLPLVLFSLLVVKVVTNRDIFSTIHLSLALNRTVNLLVLVRGREALVNLTKPATCAKSVVMSTGTAFCHMSRNSASRFLVVAAKRKSP